MPIFRSVPNPISPTRKHYEIRSDDLYLSGCKYGPLQESEDDFLCPQCGGSGTDCGEKCRFCAGTGCIEKNDTRITYVPPEEYVIRLYEEHCKMRQEPMPPEEPPI